MKAQGLFVALCTSSSHFLLTKTADMGRNKQYSQATYCRFSDEDRLTSAIYTMWTLHMKMTSVLVGNS